MSEQTEELFLKNPLLVSLQANLRAKIVASVPTNCQSKKREISFIITILNGISQKFYSRGAYSTYSSWLNEEAKNNHARIFKLLLWQSKRY